MERLYSMAEIAEKLGISVDELITVAKREGLIDEDENPTQKAIDNDILVSLKNTDINVVSLSDN